MSGHLFDKVALIGLGLIGSSLGRVMKREGLAGEIVGHARTENTLQKALSIGFVDKVEADISAAVSGADLVVMCVPVGACGKLAKDMARELKPGSILTDVGSVKAAVIDSVLPHVPAGVSFIPSHPIAGSECSGPEAGFADLFVNRWCIMTPLPETGESEIKRLGDFWKSCGSNVEIMSATHHDAVLAMTSHLPHLIAFNIVGTAVDLEEVANTEVIKYAAGGFRDFTRIAASDPVMWRDVFLNNKEAVLDVLGKFNEDLASLARAISDDDGDTLFKLFSRTSQTRQGIIAAGQDTAEPDFGRHSS
jgi:cyclohexadieny/prephenate dehydrogenase